MDIEDPQIEDSKNYQLSEELQAILHSKTIAGISNAGYQGVICKWLHNWIRIDDLQLQGELVDEWT